MNIARWALHVFHQSHSVCTWRWSLSAVWHEGRIVRWLGSSEAEGFSVLWWYCKEEICYLLMCCSHSSEGTASWFLFSFLIQSFCSAIVLLSLWLVNSYCAVNAICLLKTACDQYQVEMTDNCTRNAGCSQFICVATSLFLPYLQVLLFLRDHCGTVSFLWAMWKCPFHS